MYPIGKLRILETTDLHMHLLAQDGRAGGETLGGGLAPLADLITWRREGAHTTVLLDNGDFLQGTPLADQQAEDLSANQSHLIATCFNALGYDGVTLGNHEFDYGTGVLNTVLKHMDCAAVCANITSSKDQGWKAFGILERTLTCDDGISRPLRIGITGFAPPLITLGPDLSSANIITAAKAIVPRMKAAGADIIIALCHAGVGARGDGPENAGQALGRIAGIDALLLGHTHDQFPDRARKSTHEVSQSAGTIHGTPTVMAGYHGTSLGEIDLSLRYDGDTGWQVAQHHVQLLKPLADALPRSRARDAIEKAAKPATARLAQTWDAVITQTDRCLHNHGTCAAPDPIGQLFANVMREACSKALRRGDILAAVAPFQPSGATGKSAEITIGPGPITRRDAQRLFPFTDRLCAVMRTGADIRDWLERGASHYKQITTPQDQLGVVSRQSAKYHCDAFYGLRYQIDLAQPARFDAFGTCIAPMARRISDITFQGQRLLDHGKYIVATTSFRAAGGGGFQPVPKGRILWMSDNGLRDILITALENGAADACDLQDVWQFKTPPNDIVTGVKTDTSKPFESYEQTGQQSGNARRMHMTR